MTLPYNSKQRLLKPPPQLQLKHLGAFPPNTIIFESRDGYYINEKAIGVMMVSRSSLYSSYLEDNPKNSQRGDDFEPKRPVIPNKASSSCTYERFKRYI